MGIGAPQGLEVRGLIEDEPLPVIERRGVFAGTSARALGLMLALAVLVLVTIASLAYGAKPIPTGTVLDALTAYDPSVDDHLIVHGLRLPRTLVGLLVGMALGLAGAVMQGVTRNPLADPGILGVSAGAALFVVIGIYWFGVAHLHGYVWFSFAGAGAAAVVVYALGRHSGRRAEAEGFTVFGGYRRKSPHSHTQSTADRTGRAAAGGDQWALGNPELPPTRCTARTI
jgi:ABC-type enterobactin transport system permease subunit